LPKKLEADRQARQHVLQALDSAGHFPGVLPVLIAALLTAAPVLASRPPDVYADQPLETLLSQTNMRPGAFVEDHKIRLYYTTDARNWMLKAAWKQPRVPDE
jgi:hypothetical protein